MKNVLQGAAWALIPANGAGFCYDGGKWKPRPTLCLDIPSSAGYHKPIRIQPVVGPLFGFELTQTLISQGGKRSQRRIIDKVLHRKKQEEGKIFIQSSIPMRTET